MNVVCTLYIEHGLGSSISWFLKKMINEMDLCIHWQDMQPLHWVFKKCVGKCKSAGKMCGMCKKHILCLTHIDCAWCGLRGLCVWGD